MIAYSTRKIRVIQSAHPIPDQSGIEAVQKMLRLKQQYSIGRDDLVICLISGGGFCSHAMSG
jgi:hydroxypyruvate reductase